MLYIADKTVSELRETAARLGMEAAPPSPQEINGLAAYSLGWACMLAQIDTSGLNATEMRSRMFELCGGYAPEKNSVKQHDIDSACSLLVDLQMFNKEGNGEQSLLRLNPGRYATGLAVAGSVAGWRLDMADVVDVDEVLRPRMQTHVSRFEFFKALLKEYRIQFTPQERERLPYESVKTLMTDLYRLRAANIIDIDYRAVKTGRGRVIESIGLTSQYRPPIKDLVSRLISLEGWRGRGTAILRAFAMVQSPEQYARLVVRPRAPGDPRHERKADKKRQAEEAKQRRQRALNFYADLPDTLMHDIDDLGPRPSAMAALLIHAAYPDEWLMRQELQDILLKKAGGEAPWFPKDRTMRETLKKLAGLGFCDVKPGRFAGNDANESRISEAGLRRGVPLIGALMGWKMGVPHHVADTFLPPLKWNYAARIGFFNALVQLDELRSSDGAFSFLGFETANGRSRSLENLQKAGIIDIEYTASGVNKKPSVKSVRLMPGFRPVAASLVDAIAALGTPEGQKDASAKAMQIYNEPAHFLRLLVPSTAAAYRNYAQGHV